MKIKSYIVFIVLLFSITNYGQTTGPFNSLARNDSSSISNTYIPLLFDPGLSLRIGAENTTTIHKGISYLEDRLIGTSWFSESNFLGKTSGVAARLVKYSFLDIPLDYFSNVLAHEYFGHGARYREQDINNIHYSFDFPPPYGGGGGEASTNITQPISYQELLSIWEGGIEAHSVINKNLSLRWMSSNKITYREASQFVFSFQILMKYIQETNEDLFDGTSDNDLRAYVRILNSKDAYKNPDTIKMSVADLKSKMMLNVLNPFILNSLYTIFKSYLWDGNNSNDLFTLEIGNVSYLPSFRAGLTPFGIEYHLDNYLQFDDKTSLVDLSYGDQTFHDFWGGIGIHIQNIYKPQNFSFDVNLNVWKQPELIFGTNHVESTGASIGGAFSIRGYYDFNNPDFPISAVLELGYKSTGFIEGYNLKSSPILMLGLATRY